MLSSYKQDGRILASLDFTIKYEKGSMILARKCNIMCASNASTSCKDRTDMSSQVGTWEARTCSTLKQDSRAAHHHVKVQELAHGDGVPPTRSACWPAGPACH